MLLKSQYEDWSEVPVSVAMWQLIGIVGNQNRHTSYLEFVLARFCKRRGALPHQPRQALVMSHLNEKVPFPAQLERTSPPTRCPSTSLEDPGRCEKTTGCRGQQGFLIACLSP